LHLDSNREKWSHSHGQAALQVSTLWATVCRRPSQPTHCPTDRDLIDKLLLERLSLAAIVRVTGVSERWLQAYVNQKYYLTPKQVDLISNPFE